VRVETEEGSLESENQEALIKKPVENFPTLLDSMLLSKKVTAEF